MVSPVTPTSVAPPLPSAGAELPATVVVGPPDGVGEPEASPPTDAGLSLVSPVPGPVASAAPDAVPPPPPPLLVAADIAALTLSDGARRPHPASAMSATPTTKTRLRAPSH